MKQQDTTTTRLARKDQPYWKSFREQRDQGELVKRKRYTLDQFINLEYLPFIRRTLKSWQTSERILRCHVSPYFGQRKLCDIKRTEVLQWQQEMLKKGYTVGTSNRSLGAFRALCSYAEQLGYLPFGLSPCYKISQLAPEKREACVISPEKIAEILNILKGSDDLKAKALRLMLLTDARKNEVLKARWEDVDWENRRLRSPRDVPGELRFIELPEEAVTLLEELKKDSDGDWIFPGRKLNRPITDIYQYWNRLRNELGVPQMKMEDLRYNWVCAKRSDDQIWGIIFGAHE